MAKRGHQQDPQRIDIGLAVLACLVKPDQQLECAEIADVCDCSRDYIHKIYTRAIAKVKRHALIQAIADYQ